MEVYRLRVVGIDHQRPLAFGRRAKLLGNGGAKSGKELVGEVLLDIPHQVFNQLTGFFSANSVLLRIPIAAVAKVGPVEGQVDVFRKPSDRAERFGKRRAALEDELSSVSLL